MKKPGNRISITDHVRTEDYMNTRVEIRIMLFTISEGGSLYEATLITEDLYEKLD